jgi:hypothetical protein
MEQMDSHRKYGRQICIVDLYQRFGVIKIEKKQDPLYEGLHTSMIILVTKDNKGCAMAQAVSRRLLTVEARVRSGGQYMWDLWWTKWHWDRFSPRVLRFSPVNFIPPVLHYTE